MSLSWRAESERSNAFMLNLLAWIARTLGRPVARLILWPTVLYYFVIGTSARRASRQYLARVLDRPVRNRDMLRHMHCFASTVLDRVFLFLGEIGRLDVQVHGAHAVEELAVQGKGALLLVSHLGSFDVMRAAADAVEGSDLKVRVLMNRKHGAKLGKVLESLNPEFADAIIDTSGGDVDLILRLRAALDRGEMVGIMADRLHQSGEREVEVDFLGQSARIPASPWWLAGMLKVPVILCFGLYRGRNKYDLYFEALADRIELPRGRRQQAVAEAAQAYAVRLEHYVQQAPYNWFNFYDFWASERSEAGGQVADGE